MKIQVIIGELPMKVKLSGRILNNFLKNLNHYIRNFTHTYGRSYETCMELKTFPTRDIFRLTYWVHVYYLFS